MSHVVTIEARLHDPAAVQAACRRLGLPQPVHGTATLFSGEATGLLVTLPDWQYPAVIDLASGLVSYDNYEGRWGEQHYLERFLQIYAAEKTKIEARRRGHACTEHELEDGSIKLQILETT